MYWFITISVFLVILLYIILVNKHIRTKSIVAYLYIRQNKKTIGVIEYYAKDFSEDLRKILQKIREEKHLTLRKFAKSYGLSYIRAFLLEHKLMISPFTFISFLKELGFIEKIGFTHLVTEDSYLASWCIKKCNAFVLSKEKDISDIKRIILTRPIVFMHHELTFNKYVFKSEPIIRIITDIQSIEKKSREIYSPDELNN